jgi:hypothetical protein
MLKFSFQNQFELKLGYFVSLPDHFGVPHLQVHGGGGLLADLEYMNHASRSLYTGRAPFT